MYLPISFQNRYLQISIVNFSLYMFSVVVLLLFQTLCNFKTIKKSNVLMLDYHFLDFSKYLINFESPFCFEQILSCRKIFHYSFNSFLVPATPCSLNSIFYYFLNNYNKIMSGLYQKIYRIKQI